MLYDLLSDYNKSGVTPMHMPGHKRNTAMLGNDLPYSIDITEIDGFDNLHDAYGVLKETAELASRLYGCRRAFPLVSGSTGGILAAVSGACRPGDNVIMARNCHKSVYNAVLINHLKPVYLYPPIDSVTGICGSITPAQVKEAVLQHPEARLIIVTSPTYEGVVSDIKGICGAAHARNIPVLIDAAHGAHLGFSDYFPPDPVRCGADIAVVSLHKTLPALTQCALALLNSDRIDENRLRSALSVFQTSSPSYVLLASIDRCLRLLQSDGDHLFEGYSGNLERFNEHVGTMKRLTVLCHGADTLVDHPRFFGFDPGKIVLCTRRSGLSGPTLMKRLRTNYHIELEMAYTDYALAMTSVCDEDGAFAKLAKALAGIDKTATAADYPSGTSPVIQPRQAMTPGEAAGLTGALVPLETAEGRLSLEYVWAYPPGVPFLVPGEIIGADMIRQFRQLTDAGVALKSTNDALPSVTCCLNPANTYL